MKNFKFLSLITFMLLLPGCQWFSGNKNEAQQILSGLIIVDVNDSDIYSDIHIKGAVHLPYDKIATDTDYLKNSSSKWDKKSEIVVYCTNYQCTASDDVAKKLKELGFSNVNVLKAGIQSWYQLAQEDKKRYPYEGNAAMEFLKKPLHKVDVSEGDIKIITPQELSEKLKE